MNSAKIAKKTAKAVGYRKLRTLVSYFFTITNLRLSLDSMNENSELAPMAPHLATASAPSRWVSPRFAQNFFSRVSTLTHTQAV